MFGQDKGVDAGGQVGCIQAYAAERRRVERLAQDATAQHVEDLEFDGVWQVGEDGHVEVTAERVGPDIESGRVGLRGVVRFLVGNIESGANRGVGGLGREEVYAVLSAVKVLMTKPKLVAGSLIHLATH